MNIKKFGKVRKAALKYWLNSTKRKRVGLDDSINSTYECRWQNANKVGFHVSLYCSFGTFCTNITDLLTDERFDKINPYKTEVDNQIIFRFYGRLFLVVSEILTDFEDIFNQIKENKNTNARDSLSIPSGVYTFDNFIGFTNNIFKHKLKSIHVVNHHADIFFDDLNEYEYDKNLRVVDIINFKHLKNETTIDIIKIPTLISIIDQILFCYNIIDKEFKNKNTKYLKFLESYISENH